MHSTAHNQNAIRDLAHVLYCLLYGDIPDQQAVVNSREIIASLIPQHSFGEQALADKDRYARISSAQRLFEQRAHFLTQWVEQFDERGFPRSAAIAENFLKQYFEAFSRFPRLDQDVLCREAVFKQGSLMDHDLVHPCTVDYYTFYLTLAGKGQLQVSGKLIDIEPGSVFIVPPTCECVLRRHGEVLEWNFYSGHFRLRNTWTDLLDWVEDFSRAYRVRLDSGAFSIVEKCLQQITTTRVDGDELSARLSENLMEEVLIRLKMSAPAATAVRDRRVVRAVNYVLQHVEENISISELADLLQLSSSHLSSLFRAEMGAGLVKWREGIRMEQAARLLQHTTLPIGEIGRRVGYDDQLYFSRKFKHAMQQVPTDYRGASRKAFPAHSTE